MQRHLLSFLRACSKLLMACLFARTRINPASGSGRAFLIVVFAGPDQAGEAKC
jgi:hypothetical protein